MLSILHTLRRRLAKAGVRGALAGSQRLSPPRLMQIGRSVGRTGSVLLRKPLQKNMELVLGRNRTTEAAVSDYFRNFGNWAGAAVAIYHHGLSGSGITDRIQYGPTVVHLDSAMAEGRGVVLAAPHLFAHEMAAALINLRHRVVALVRDSGDSRKQAIKRRWYESLGLKTITLARASAPVTELMECVDLLRDGYVLGITPDLISTSPHNVPVRVFGRPVSVNPGLIAIAMYSRAPLVSCYGMLDDQASGKVEFTEPRHFASPKGKQRKSDYAERVIAGGLQEWFDEFELFVRSHPQAWMFWLDKRWSRVFRTQQVITKAA